MEAEQRSREGALWREGREGAYHRGEVGACSICGM